MGSEAQRLDGHPGRARLQNTPEGVDAAGFRLLAESLPHPVWVCGPSGTLQYMNRCGLQYFGSHLHQPATPFPSGSLAHPDDSAISRESWSHACADGEAFNLRMRLHRSDGAFRWHSLDTQPIRDTTGYVTGWLGAATRMDASKRDDPSAFLLALSTDVARMDDPHEMICEVMLRLRQRLGAGQVALAEIDEPREEAIVLRQDRNDPSTLQLVSLPLEVLGHSPFDTGKQEMGVISDTSTDPLAASRYARCCGLEEVGAIVSAPLRRAGALVAVLIIGESSPRDWRTSEIELIRRVAELVWPALEKARAERALALSEQRLRLAQAVTRIGAWELDPRAGSISFSTESYELFGLQEAGAADLYERWMRRVDARDRAVLSALVRECLGSGKAHAEYRYFHPQRGERWIYCRAGAVKESGRACIVGVSLDVTERRRAEEALKDVNRRKDQFLAMLGHELRNPLAPIRNAVQILSSHSGGSPEIEWAHKVLERQTRHLTRLVDDLLEVARAVRGQIVLRTAPLQLSEWVQNAIETTQPLIGARRHRLHVSLPAELVQLRGDLLRLSQALANLLNNAARYTEAGGEIWLDARLQAGEVELRVSDTGPGLSADLLPHVFDLFTQSERPLDRAQGGLGIGLTLVKLLIEMHGGSVEARNSQRHPGAEFIIRLPAQKVVEAERDCSCGCESAPSPDPHLKPETERSMRVLIVDDNVDAAESIALLLSLDGFDARTVHSATEVFEVVAAFTPDVILLDIGLPVMDGYEVARELKARFLHHKMRIVALSGYGQPADRRRAAQAGFDDYLVKPVEAARLSALLRKQPES